MVPLRMTRSSTGTPGVVTDSVDGGQLGPAAAGQVVERRDGAAREQLGEGVLVEADRGRGAVGVTQRDDELGPAVVAGPTVAVSTTGPPSHRCCGLVDEVVPPGHRRRASRWGFQASSWPRPSVARQRLASVAGTANVYALVTNSLRVCAIDLRLRAGPGLVDRLAAPIGEPPPDVSRTASRASRRGHGRSRRARRDRPARRRRRSCAASSWRARGVSMAAALLGVVNESAGRARDLRGLWRRFPRPCS